MLNVRRSESRAYFEHNWLKSYRSFSFEEERHAEHAACSVLNAFNDDEIKDGMGFGMQSHQNVEVLTYVLSGELHYHDNLGNQATLSSGDVQLLSAGYGVRHDEYNMAANPVHILQLWITPFQEDLPPSYGNKRFSSQDQRNKWCLIASPFGRQGSLPINQNVDFHVCTLTPKSTIEVAARSNRDHYLHIAEGSVTCNGVMLRAGDALKFHDESRIGIKSRTGADLVWLDLPMID